MNGAVTKLYDIDSITIPEELLALSIEDSEIEEKVRMLSVRYANESEADIAALGDTVYCKADETGFPDKRTVIIFTGTALPGAEDAAEKAIGKSVNDTFEAVLAEKNITLTVEKIIRRTPSEVNDELIKSVGIEGVGTIDEYKAYLKEQQLSDMRMERHKAIFAYFLTELVNNSEFSYDEKELKDYTDELIAQYPPDEDFGMSREDLEENVRAQVKEEWITDEFCKEKNIEFDMKEIEEETDRMLEMQALMGEELPPREEMIKMYMQNVKFGALYEYVDKIATEKLGG